MRKLAPARVSYQDDFLISYRVYMMLQRSFSLAGNDGYRAFPLK